MKTLLLLGAGGAAANSVARCLTRSEGFRIVGANCDPYDLALAEVNDRRLIPRCGDEGWEDAIRALVDEIQPDFVHAQPEQEVLALSRLRDELPGGDLMVRADTVALAQDKWASHDRWIRAGVPQPRTWRIDTDADLAKAWNATDGTIWLRASRGAGGAGSLQPRSYSEALGWLDRHDGWGSFTAADVLSRHTVVVQMLWRAGVPVASQAKRRLRWANARNVPSGIGGSAAISETCTDPDAFTRAVDAVRALDKDADGIFSVDMAYRDDGALCPTEVNVGRFNTTVDFLAVAGLNLPLHHFAGGEPIAPDPLEDGLLWIRSMDRPPVFTNRALLEAESTPLEAVA